METTITSPPVARPVARLIALPTIRLTAAPAIQAKPTTKPVVKLAYVNALRGWAILLVILVHNSIYLTADAAQFPSLFNVVINQGARGVQLFFVISAFTLFLSMARCKQEKHPVRNFFIRRFFRIAPMYYIGVIFYTGWFCLVEPRPVTVPGIAANITFLHGISPYWMINSSVPGGWSITVEMWFYCLAPWLFHKIKTIDQTVRFIALSILLACLLHAGLILLHPLDSDELWLAYLFFFFPNQLAVFGFGILLYLLVAGKQKDNALQPTTLMLAAGAALLVLFTGFGNDLLHRTGTVSEGQHYWFAAAFMALAFGLSKYASRLLVNPIITYIGEVSFSLYLVHFAILFILNKTGYGYFVSPTNLGTALLDFALRYVFVVGSGVAVSLLFYRLVEIPCQNLGKRLIARLEA